MYATLHSMVYLHPLSELPSRCMKLLKYGIRCSITPKTPHRMEGICPNVPLTELSKTQHRYYPSGMLLSLKNHFQHVQLVGNWNVDEKSFKAVSVHGIHEIHSIYIVASRGYIIYSDRRSGSSVSTAYTISK